MHKLRADLRIALIANAGHSAPEDVTPLSPQRVHPLVDDASMSLAESVAFRRIQEELGKASTGSAAGRRCKHRNRTGR